MNTQSKALLVVFTCNYFVCLLKWAFFQPTGDELFWLADIATHLLIPTLLLLILAKHYGITPKSYSLVSVSNDPRRQGVWSATIIYTVILSATYYGGYVIGLILENEGIYSPSSSFLYNSVIPPQLPARILAVFYFAISAAVFEEIFFRGVFQLACDAIFTKPSRLAVVFFSALFFASTHWASGIPALTGSFFFGLVAAWFFNMQRDLRPLVAAHFFLDVFVFY